jgi:NAD(P)-dependent dehydrogenase (short-subunit alcohol dehydrogenase family)
MAMRFSGKVALVTGAASGIGRAGAQLFAREGAKVIVTTGTNVSGGEETVRLIKEAGGEASFVVCDVSKDHDVRKMVETAVDRYGRLDFAFNNAGIGPDGKRVPVVDIVDMPEDLWDRTIDINLKGVFLCLKYEMRQMIAQGGGGSIVSTSSVGAVKPQPGFCAYNASKSGLGGLTRTAAIEGAPHNIRVNAILPGPTMNTLLFDYLTTTNPDVKGDMENDVPLHRLAYPEDMAEAVMWLCSDTANFVTGQCLPIDGGITAR